MSDNMAEVLRLLQEVDRRQENFRRETREDLKEIKAEVKRTNGRVTDARDRITVLETKEEGDHEGKKRRRDAVPFLVSGAITIGVTVVANALIFGGHP